MDGWIGRQNEGKNFL